MPRRSLLTLIVLTVGAAVAAVAAVPAPTAAEPETYTIDAGHSAALFHVQHLGAGMFHGRFDRVNGTITIDEHGVPSFDVTIPIESIHTGMDNLDKHLLSPDFFDAATHESMSFRSTASRRSGRNRWEVGGDFTLRGVTSRITAAIVHHGSADMGRGNRAGWEARFSVMRSEFGVSYGVESGALGDETGIVVSMEAVQQVAEES